MIKILVLFTLLVTLAGTANAQRDHVGNETFTIDSLTITLKQWHTQDSAQEKKGVDSFINKYLYVFHDTLWAEFPAGYIPYVTDNPLTGRRDYDKVMIQTIGETERVTFFAHNLIGKGSIPIVNIKKKRYVYLSL